MIRVNKDYVIEIDSFNYTAKRDLHRKGVRKDRLYGTEVEVDQFTTVGYYGDLTGAIKGIIRDMNNRRLTDGEHTLEEALSIILENNKKVSDLLEKVLEV